MGAGLTGWVAENASVVVNGNPAVDPDFTHARRISRCVRHWRFRWKAPTA